MESKVGASFAVLLCIGQLNAEVVEIDKSTALTTIKMDTDEFDGSETKIEEVIAKYAEMITETTGCRNRNAVQRLYANNRLDFTSGEFHSAGIAIYVSPDLKRRVYIAVKHHNTQKEKSDMAGKDQEKSLKDLLDNTTNFSHTERQLVRKICEDNKFKRKRKKKIIEAHTILGDLYIYTKENPCLYTNGVNDRTSCCEFYKKESKNTHILLSGKHPR